MTDANPVAPNYREARGVAYGHEKGPVTPARRKNMPNWLEAHLYNVTCYIQDVLDHRDTLQAELAQAHQAQALTQAEHDLEFCGNQKPYDHTMADLDQDGRYDGDLLARLFFEPLVDTKKRWKVEVSEWRIKTYTERGHREGYKDSAAWYEAHRFMTDGFETKSFRTSERALDYLGRVRASADAGHMRRRLRDISTGQSSQVA